MTIGSLVLLGLFIFWGITLFLLSKTAKKFDIKRGISYCILQNLKIFTGEYMPLTKIEVGVERYNNNSLKLLMVFKFGYLIFFLSLIRLVLEPDLLTLALTIISSLFYVYHVFRLYKVKETYSNWRNLYELDVDYGVLEITLVPEGPGREWIGSTLAELNLRKKELLVLAIIRKNQFTVFPKGPETLVVGDRVLVFGKYPQFGFARACSDSSITQISDTVNNHQKT